eukprot:131433-Chlamydomonas_euryale.AAC.1
MVHLAPTFTSCTADDAALLFTAHVFAHNGLLQSIITDRGPQFTGNFWAACVQMLGIRHSKSTAFHPQ